MHKFRFLACFLLFLCSKTLFAEEYEIHHVVSKEGKKVYLIRDIDKQPKNLVLQEVIHKVSGFSDDFEDIIKNKHENIFSVYIHGLEIRKRKHKREGDIWFYMIDYSVLGYVGPIYGVLVFDLNGREILPVQ